MASIDTRKNETSDCRIFPVDGALYRHKLSSNELNPPLIGAKDDREHVVDNPYSKGATSPTKNALPSTPFFDASIFEDHIKTTIPIALIETIPAAEVDRNISPEATAMVPDRTSDIISSRSSSFNNLTLAKRSYHRRRNAVNLNKIPSS